MANFFRLFLSTNRNKQGPLLIVLSTLFVLVGCTSSPESTEIAQAARVNSSSIQLATLPATQTPLPTLAPPSGPTARPTTTPSPTPTLTPTSTHTPTPSATPTKQACRSRVPNPDNLLFVVSKEFGLGPDYEAPNLVPLSDYFDQTITRGYPTEVSEIIIDPLVNLISDMQAAGLDPYIISGYRGYWAQEVAYLKWKEKEPDRVAILSALPGHSEHQLGTTIDFGSYNLHQYLDDSFPDNTQFHTLFYKTPEGIWLDQNAHKYGFTLSYPLSAWEITGFYYEPWHYRYVGVGNATVLKDNYVSLTEYQLNQDPWPCIPD
ncbi:MAG: M15 family metallopeptidase [Anaerolineae bacterium]